MSHEIITQSLNRMSLKIMTLSLNKIVTWYNHTVIRQDVTRDNHTTIRQDVTWDNHTAIRQDVTWDSHTVIRQDITLNNNCCLTGCHMNLSWTGHHMRQSLLWDHWHWQKTKYEINTVHLYLYPIFCVGHQGRHLLLTSVISTWLRDTAASRGVVLSLTLGIRWLLHG